MVSLYDKDFYAWANEQAALLRAGNLAAADIEHIAEEIESMGKTEKRELIGRLAVLLLHLLKWQFQPMLQGSSWRATIKIQRRDLARHLTDNPSLKSKLPEAIDDAYGNAILLATAETGLPETTFPAHCPWSLDQIGSDEFWPDHH
jgi:ribosomal protein L29